MHFLIVQHLTRQAQQGASGRAAFDAGGGEQTDAGFDGGENVGGGKRAGAMIGDLRAGLDARGLAAESADHAADDAEGFGMALNAEEDAVEARACARAETLHGMNDAGPGAEGGEGSEDIGAERAAGVQDDFAAHIGAALLGELNGDGGESIVGNSEEDDGGIEHAAGGRGAGGPAADGADRGARGGQSSRGHGADAPSGLAEPGAETASDAACADDGERAVCRIVQPAHAVAALARAILIPQRIQGASAKDIRDCILHSFTS